MEGREGKKEEGKVQRAQVGMPSSSQDANDGPALIYPLHQEKSRPVSCVLHFRIRQVAWLHLPATGPNAGIPCLRGDLPRKAVRYLLVH